MNSGKCCRNTGDVKERSLYPSLGGGSGRVVNELLETTG